LLIPTTVLRFGADIKLARSLSLAVSLPTMITGFARYSRDQTAPLPERPATPRVSTRMAMTEHSREHSDDTASTTRIARAT
jgi:hypothetical protein